MRSRSLRATSTTSPLPIGAVSAMALAACLTSGCQPRAATTPSSRSGAELNVFAEGTCPKLSMAAVGERRFLIYGDTGYDLHAWMPGDRVAAAVALAEIDDGRVYFNPAISAGLPTDARGYVTGTVTLGGDFETGAWLLRETTRYARGGTGDLFEREVDGYLFAGNGWRRSSDPVALPHAARKLPAPPTDMCGDEKLRWVPLAWEATPSGGIVAAGRCDDDAAPNLHRTTVVTLHGRAGASAWTIARVPEAEMLDGIINVDLDARSDDDVLLTAYEPFVDRPARQSFIAAFDGTAWEEKSFDIDDGVMSVARDGDSLFVAAGRALYVSHGGSAAKKLSLPALAHATVRSEDLHIHRVVVPSRGELWVEASYRVKVRAPSGRLQPVWASALFTNTAQTSPIYCDAAEPSEAAIFEVSP